MSIIIPKFDQSVCRSLRAIEKHEAAVTLRFLSAADGERTARIIRKLARHDIRD